jgi:hypothetical protein
MPGPARQQLALAALSGVPVTRLASESHVSRKFVYQQVRRAHQGLAAAFAPAAPAEDVLFWLPVTKPWLHQLVLGLVLICHSSLRGACELLTDVFDYPLSVGSAHNILSRAVPAAERIDAAQGLSAVRFAALDEIFQSADPVLVGADVYSTYCYLLSQEEHRDGDTWAVRLLELRDRGFDPEATVADFGTGLRKGQRQALPGTPCRADAFHALRDFRALLARLDARAYEAIAQVDELKRRQARHEWRRGRKDRRLVGRAVAAAQAAEQAVALADDVATLFGWLRQDVLAVAGPDHATRLALYDWVLSELQAREGRCAGIGPVRLLLANHKDDLLSFAAALDSDLRGVADRLQVPVGLAREALAVQQLGTAGPGRRHREEQLKSQLGGKYEVLRAQVEALAGGVVRASSVIENLNSRLRSYFFLRRQLGPDYLKLLKFYLNHRRFTRSEHPHREGKSPRELLSGQAHPHWLELLGYQRFHRQ